MSPEPTASADPDASAAAVQRRRRRTALLAVLIALIVWPGLLDGDLPHHRMDSLRVLGPLAPRLGGAAGAGPSRAHRRRPQLAHARPSPPANYGAVVEDAPVTLLASEQPAGPGRITLAELAGAAPGQLLPAIFSPSPSGGPGPDLPFGLPGVGGPSYPEPFPVIAPATPPPTLPPGQPPSPPVIISPPGQPPDTPPVTPPVTPPPLTPPDTPPPIVGPPIAGPPDTPPPIVGPLGPPVTPPGVSCVEAGDCPTDGGPGGGPGGGGPGGSPGGAVPEPALWAQMILGTLLAGAALRRRRLQLATALRARSKA
jgi:hypothetical protein